MTMKPRILVTRSLPGNALDALFSQYDVTVNPHDRNLEKAELISLIRDKEGIISLLTDPIDKEVLDAAPKLKVISNYAVGFNNIDIPEATKRKIPVCTTPGILTDSVADLTFGLILAIARRMIESDRFTRSHLFKGWAPELFLGTDIHGKTLGIVGMGRIGQAVAKRASGFDMNIIYTARKEYNLPGATQVSLEELLRSSDFVSLHTPLTPETRHMIKAKQLKLMKKTAYLINTTRGPVVEEIALVEALKHKTIAGAGLDVYENEPELSPGLEELPNVILLPHIASATLETRSKMAELAVQNLMAIFERRAPLSIVNESVL